MAEKYPNMNMLVALTMGAAAAADEKLLFLHSKVMPDFEPTDDVYMLAWHKQCMKTDGMTVSETCLVGRSEVINSLFDSCVTDGMISLKDRNVDKVLKLSLPKDYVIDVPTADTEGRNDHSDRLYRAKQAGWLPEFMFDRGVIDALSGYAVDDTVKPIVPAGLYEKGWLYDKICNNVFGVREERKPYVGFHGVRATAVDGRGCMELIGFEQSDVRAAGDSCRLLDFETKETLAESEIDPATGIFRLRPVEPIKNGTLVFDAADAMPSLSFGLILGIDVNAEAASGRIEDLYGNELWLGKLKKRPATFESATWYEAAAAGGRDVYAKLSEIFVEVLATLGRDVVIVDPYFIGSVEEDACGNLVPTATQRAFINALVTVAVDYGLDSVTVVGNSRMNNHGEEATDDKSKMDVLKAKYERLWRGFFGGALFKHVKPWKMVFRRAKTDFHNRYWFEGDGNMNVAGNRAVIVSNSLSGMIEADFCSIESRHHYDTVASRYDGIIRKSELFVEI